MRKKFHAHNFSLCQHPVADGWMSRRPALGLRWKNTTTTTMNVEKNSFTSPKSSSSFSASLCVRALLQPASSVTFLAYQHLLVTAPTFDSTHETTHTLFLKISTAARTAGWLWNFNWGFFSSFLFFFSLHFQLRSSTFSPCPASSTLARLTNVALQLGISSTTLALNGLAHTRTQRERKILAMNFPAFFSLSKKLERSSVPATHDTFPTLVKRYERRCGEISFSMWKS